uniref:Uncharacterized protein n=1 Tax=Parastrongyloides trichosuri TaxID=131310 RepID=A0A0N4Z5S7_PARTI
MIRGYSKSKGPNRKKSDKGSSNTAMQFLPDKSTRKTVLIPSPSVGLPNEQKPSRNKSRNRSMYKYVDPNNSWQSTFIYLAPKIEPPVEGSIVYTPLDVATFDELSVYAKEFLRKKEEQERREDMARTRKKFSLGDFFPSFRRKNKRLEKVENRLKINLTSTEIHPYYGLSVKEEMRTHPNFKYVIPKNFVDTPFNIKGRPFWAPDEDEEDTDESESLQLAMPPSLGTISFNPYRKKLEDYFFYDKLFQYEYVISNTLRSIVKIKGEKNIQPKKYNVLKQYQDKHVTFGSLPIKYYSFRRECPYKKYIKIPYTCTNCEKRLNNDEVKCIL